MTRASVDQHGRVASEMAFDRAKEWHLAGIESREFNSRLVR